MRSSMLPRRPEHNLGAYARSDLPKSRPARPDQSIRLPDLAAQADYTMLGGTGAEWLADDSFGGHDKSRVTFGGQSAGTPRGDVSHDVTELEDEEPEPPEEMDSEEDPILAAYRNEPSCDVTAVLQHQTRRKSFGASVSESAPFSMSTPHPARKQVPLPAPMTMFKDLSPPRLPRAPSRAPTPAPPTGQKRNRSLSSGDLSTSSGRHPDDMFERKKRDSNRLSGIVFEAPAPFESPVLLPPETVFVERIARPMVKLPNRRSTVVDVKGKGKAKEVPVDMPPPPIPQAQPPKPAARPAEPDVETAPVATSSKHILSASVPGLTLPKEFALGLRSAAIGMSARERSAARAAELTAAKMSRASSAAFAAPTAKPIPRGAFDPPAELLTRPATALGNGRPRSTLGESTNKRVVSAPTHMPKPGRAGLAQSQPARKQIVAVPFTFASDHRSNRPRQTEALPPSFAEERKRKRLPDDAPRATTTTVRAFDFHTDKRRRDA